MIRILHGDCRTLMATLDEHSVDAIVTDPPYELGFMGKSWDSSGVASDPATWRAALRVLKPGGHLLAFGGTRTYHRMVCAIEDGGFEIRDQIGWVYGSGFPKSRNLDGEWEGWGTALKPAWEPIVLARAPLERGQTVAANVAVHRTGAINVDGCRIPTADDTERVSNGGMRGGNFASGQGAPGPIAGGHALGRWPANVIHDGSDEVLAAFPEAPGQIADASASASASARMGQNVYGSLKKGNGRDGQASAVRRYAEGGNGGFAMQPGARRGDTGSAARFFYSAKASNADRHAGLGHVPPQFKKGSTLRDAERIGASRRGNHHPTVKPTELMRYLCRLITPPGGVVLDPFMGSGSTLKGAELEGFDAIGMELDADYVRIAQARIAADAPLFADVRVEVEA